MTTDLLLLAGGAAVVLVLLGVLLLGGGRVDRRVRIRLESLGHAAEADPERDSEVTSLVYRRRFENYPDLIREPLLKVDHALAATGYAIGLPHLAAVALIGAAAGFLFFDRLLQLGFMVAVMAGTAGLVFMPLLVLRYFRSRHQNRFLDLFPDAIDLIVRAVKAGLPVSEALATVGREVPHPVGTEFRRVRDEMQIGVDIDEALVHASDRIGLPDFRFFVASLALQRETGGSLAETLDNLSRIIRRRKELRLKARAMTSEARTSAMVIGSLPFVAGGALSILNPDYLMRLFADSSGNYLLGVATASLVIGIVVMKTIIKRSLA